MHHDDNIHVFNMKFIRILDNNLGYRDNIMILILFLMIPNL